MTCRTASLNNLPSINPFQIQETTPRSGFISENPRPVFFFYEVLLFTCQTARCHCATTLQSVSAWQAGDWVCNCGSDLSHQTHQLCCKSPLCVLLQNRLNPSELSPVWCSRRRVPRCKWTSRAINIDPTNVAKHRPKFARTPLALLTEGT